MSVTSIANVVAAATPGPREAESPEAAAEQFEAVLVRQFVEVMTQDLFKGGEEGMLTGQADLQRDTLTDALTDHLVESGAFGIADLLLAQWERTGYLPAAAPTGPSPAARPGARTGAASPVRPDAPPSPSGAMTMEEALRRYAPPQVRPPAIDPPSLP